jgi:hypothetical protein
MNKKLILFGVLGVVIVAAIWGAGLLANKGSHVVLNGKIQKVRIKAVDEETTAVVVDFRYTNPANYSLVVRDVTIEIVTEDGEVVSGRTVADIDAERFLAAYPELGGKFNPSLKTREKILPKQTDDRMIAASFELTEAQVEKRRSIRVRIQDVDRPVSVIE